MILLKITEMLCCKINKLLTIILSNSLFIFMLRKYKLLFKYKLIHSTQINSDNHIKDNNHISLVNLFNTSTLQRHFPPTPMMCNET